MDITTYKSRHLQQKIMISILVLVAGLGVVTLLQKYQQASAASYNYSFSSDTVGSPPSGISMISGSVAVANSPALGGNALTVTGYASGSSVFSFNNFPVSEQQEVTWRAAYTNGEHRGGVFLRYSRNVSHNGYIFQVNTGASFQDVRIYRQVEGVSTQLGSNYPLASAGVGVVRHYRAVANGPNLSFYWSTDGAAWNQVATVTDTTFTSGSVAWRDYVANSGTNRNYMDDFTYVYDDPVVDSLSITSPSNYQVFQRDDDDTATISIEGTYEGNPEAIEARWRGGSWTTIATNPTGGVFSGQLVEQTTGQGEFEVRIVGENDTLTTRQYVGVGDIYVMAGQSNMSGRGVQNQAYAHPTLKAGLFGNDDSWKELQDPYDSHVGQIDAVSADTQSSKGSFVPLLATRILQNTNVPVAFIPVAKGSSSITEWSRSASPSTLYGSMARRINEVGAVKAVLWFQGESNGSMSPEQYSSRLSGFADAVAADFGGVPTIPTIIGSQSAEGITRGNVRIGTILAVDENPNLLMGPAVYDVNIDDEGGDGTHFISNGDLQVLADRWWYALSEAFYGGENGSGPRIQTVSYYRNLNAIDLVFAEQHQTGIQSMTADETTFVVQDGSGPLSIQSVVQISATTVRLQLTDVPVNETLTVSYGYDNRLTIQKALYDSDGLPAIPFMNQLAAIYDTYPTPADDTTNSAGVPSGTSAPTTPGVPNTGVLERTWVRYGVGIFGALLLIAVVFVRKIARIKA